MTEFEKIYEANQGFIYKFLLNYCKDTSLAEELTQETFFKAFMNFHSLRCVDKAPAWLCRIAKNTYFAWYQQQKRNKPLYEATHICCEDVESITIQRELSNSAMCYVQTLKEPYKEVFLLCALGELSLKDISQLFGKSESWARVTFYRARQKILDEMRENHEL